MGEVFSINGSRFLKIPTRSEGSLLVPESQGVRQDATLLSMRTLRWTVGFLVAILIITWLVLPGIVEGRNNRLLKPPPYQVSTQARLLHRSLLVADLHADSLLWGRNLLKRSSQIGRAHV